MSPFSSQPFNSFWLCNFVWSASFFFLVGKLERIASFLSPSLFIPCPQKGGKFYPILLHKFITHRTGKIYLLFPDGLYLGLHSVLSVNCDLRYVLI